MVVKKGLFSAYEMGGLAGISEVVAQAAAVTENVDTNLEGIFYATAFQSGVEQFLVYPLDIDKLRVSDFVKKRMSFVSPTKYLKHIQIVQKAFNDYLPTDYRSNKIYAPTWRLEYFLQDILAAMDLKSSLLTVLQFPNIVESQAIIPPSLFIPIRNLFNSVKYETVVVPVPRLSVSVDDIKRFQEILNSDLFSKYSHAQEELEHSRTVTAKAVSNVARIGRQIFANNQTVLTLRSTVLGILQTTPLLIETAFGKLPGALSEVACKTVLALIGEKRNLVVYTFNQLLMDAINIELGRMLTTPEKRAEFLEWVNRFIGKDD
jgi:hypothetical protein